MKYIFSFFFLFISFVSLEAYSSDTPPAPSDDKILLLLKEDANNGNTKSQYKLGNIYLKGEGVSKSITKARKLFEQAAAKGHLKASYELGMMYLKGLGVLQDFTKARQWLGLAIDPETQYDLGMELYKSENYIEAIEWLKKSAEKGHPDAQDKLGMMYLKGEGVPRNITKARKWLPLRVILNRSTPFEKLEILGASAEAGKNPCPRQF